MNVFYIAHRYRADTINQVYQHVQEARACAADIWKAGGCALAPTMNSALMDGVAPDATFLEGGLELLRRCDAIVVVVDGDLFSSGVVAEVEEAKRRKMPVYFWAEEGDGAEIVQKYASNGSNDITRQ